MNTDLEYLRSIWPINRALHDFAGIEAPLEGKICCPLHHEKTPSFSIFAGGEAFNCFGCGAKGDVFMLVGLLTGDSFRAVVRRLDPDMNSGVQSPVKRAPHPANLRKRMWHEIRIQYAERWDDIADRCDAKRAQAAATAAVGVTDSDGAEMIAEYAQELALREFAVLDGSLDTVRRWIFDLPQPSGRGAKYDARIRTKTT